MAQFDLPLDQLRDYRPDRHEPADFDAFWAATLAEARARSSEPTFRAADVPLATVQVNDVTFAGFGGDPIRAWLILPRDRAGRIAAVVEYLGYGRGRGDPLEWLTWASLGYAHLVVDARGQGGQWSAGDTADPAPPDEPHHPGFVTRGIGDRDRLYFRRLITDAVLAVDVARAHPAIDPERVVVAGTSQGGGLALAVAGLHPGVAALLSDMPFLADIRHATEITDAHPYAEIVGYLRIHRDAVETVFETLSYVDGVNFATRATAPALFSVGLMDPICPPSTVFAAFNHYAGAHEIDVWPYNGHDGGGIHHLRARIAFLERAGLAGERA